jgi:hypothetical protein
VRHRSGDLRGVLLGVLAEPTSQKLDRHAAQRGMATFARPLVVGEHPEQPRHLLVLGDDRVAEVPNRLAAGQAGRAITFLVEVGEERTLLVQEPADPETLDVHHDVAQVGQRFQPGPLAGARWPDEPVWRRRVHGAAHGVAR